MSPRSKSGQFASAKDLKPQILRISVVSAVQDAFSEAEVATPTIAEAGFVMEILRVTYTVNMTGHLGYAANDIVFGALYDRSTDAIPELSDSGVLISDSVQCMGLGVISDLRTVDFMDGDGNGLLYAKKSIFAGTDSVTASYPAEFHAAILYRLVEVTPAELIGLLAD